MTPDVILVGEMRDHETVETALLAAPKRASRVLDPAYARRDRDHQPHNHAVFPSPPHPQRQSASISPACSRSGSRSGCCSRADGLGRVPAVEVMIATGFIRDCIVDKDRTTRFHGALAAGTVRSTDETFDQSIFSLFNHGLVTLDEALRWRRTSTTFKLKVRAFRRPPTLPARKWARNSPDITRFGG